MRALKNFWVVIGSYKLTTSARIMHQMDEREGTPRHGAGCGRTATRIIQVPGLLSGPTDHWAEFDVFCNRVLSFNGWTSRKIIGSDRWGCARYCPLYRKKRLYRSKRLQIRRSVPETGLKNIQIKSPYIYTYIFIFLCFLSSNVI